jgi:hypothetical protein
VGQRDWTDDLILDQKDRVGTNLANLVLILRKRQLAESACV